MKEGPAERPEVEAGGEPSVEALGAPTDLVRPTGRLADESGAIAQAKAILATRGRKALQAFAIVLVAIVLLALLFFAVTALLPKPDL